jgi:hypothetical protein
MAAIVVPVGDCSIAMMRACFEPVWTLLAFGWLRDCCEGFSPLTDDGDFAGDGFLADFDIEILHSAVTASRRTTEAPHQQ